MIFSLWFKWELLPYNIKYFGSKNCTLGFLFKGDSQLAINWTIGGFKNSI